MKKKLGRLLLCCGLAGCATEVPREETAIAAPADRVLAFQAAAGGDATLIVTRDAGMMGSGCKITVYIDGVEAARLKQSERATFHIPAGAHILGAGFMGGGLCGLGSGGRRESDATFGQGQTRKYRVFLTSEGDFGIAPTTL